MYVWEAWTLIILIVFLQYMNNVNKIEHVEHVSAMTRLTERRMIIFMFLDFSLPDIWYAWKTTTHFILRDGKQIFSVYAALSSSTNILCVNDI